MGGPQPKVSANGRRLVEDPIKIRVEMLTGETLFEGAVDRSDTPVEVKTKIQDKKGIPPECQRLIFRGKQLEDSRTLESYDIPTESTVDVILQEPPEKELRRRLAHHPAFLKLIE